MTERHVEIGISVNADRVPQDLGKLEQDLTSFQNKVEQLAGGSFDPGIASKVAPFTPLGMPTGTPGGVFGAPAPMPQPTTDPGVPGGGAGASPGVEWPLSIGPGTNPWTQPSGANIPTPGALPGDTGQTALLKELIDSLGGLRGTIQEDSKKKDGIGELLQWTKMQSLMSLGGQVMGQAQGGNLLGAAGTGLGGAAGLLFGPAGMAAGAAIGGGIGGFFQSLAGGAGGARAYEKDITDMNQRFGLGSLGTLRNYRQGEEFGYTAEDSAGLSDRLRENRAISDPAQAGPMVRAVQELTRALGLNVEATAEMVGLYSRTGGEKGDEGARGYLADVVGGAIRSGFESNIQQYADVMGSARMQSVQSTGQGVSDRAFGMLQDVFAGLTGGNSNTAGLFRDNAQMAGAGVQSFMSYGGTANPYSTSAAYMRLAGIGEAQLDTRFNDTEQIAQNAQRSLGFTTNRLQQMSGMSASEFQSAAAADPNFVQGLIGNNVGLQRQTASIVGGFLGRDATAQDLRAYEELTNLSAANGGQLPTGGGEGAARVEELMKQLQASPADEMRQKEAARHNAVMQAMSNFMGLQTKIDEQMTGIAEWFNGMDLKAVEGKILGAMDLMETGAKWLVEKAPEIRDKIFEMSDIVIQWATDNNLLPGLKAGFDGMMTILKGAFGLGQNVVGAVAPGYGAAMRNPVTQAFVGAGARVGVDAVLPGARGAMGLARRLLGVDDSFNDTPGGVTATPGYNTFRFAPGDVVTARQGATSGGSTLTDLNLTMVQGHALGTQWHREEQEQGGVLQDVVDKMHELFGKTQADIETLTAKYVPYLMETSFALVTAAGVRDGLLAKIEGYFPVAIAAIGAVRDAVASMGGIGGGGTGGAGGGSLAAIASGLFTGPRANIGGSSPNHIDTKFSTSLSWEEIDAYFMQMAQAYQEQGRRIEFSNAAVSGQVYDPNADQADRIAMLRRAAGAHRPRAGFHSFDYYIPEGNDARSESPNSSSAGAEIMIPSAPGGRLDYGTAGNYGNFVRLYDANGNLVMTTGHGDNRRALPQDRTLPTAPVAGAGGPGGLPDLGQGYDSLEGLANELSSLDPRFNPSTPEGRSALVLALGIGGSEVYSRGSTADDYFSRRGGTGRNMLGFAQYNLRYHDDETSNPRAYADFTADILTGQRAQPNGSRGQNWAAQLSQAVQSGQIQSGAQLEQWMRRQGMGGSNWQGVDDGFSRVPGLSDQLLRYLRQPGGNTQASAAGSRSVVVNIAMNGSNLNPGDVERAARTGVETASVDEFEQRRSVDRNPRNRGGLSPVYG
ncbi:hypothetical protein VB780_25985 [Leptolyngbya sp. CCNP1308]|uniref:hypothetical protein n=1 Tax=Leptolyngbya sp. CCNP1308 TaxID=3110255 RepID=UPI002B20DD41|nr:hypothetical protein [Leptolyngbya sp. CCNP1308]MEA5452051.1 hypothetical protein [Leptolyngbya sp. CCNP1308]